MIKVSGISYRRGQTHSEKTRRSLKGFSETFFNASENYRLLPDNIRRLWNTRYQDGCLRHVTDVNFENSNDVYS